MHSVEQPASQFNLGGLITQRTQESLDGNQSEFQLEDMHHSRDQLHQQQNLRNMPQNNEILYAPKIDERSEEQESMSMSMQEETISLLDASNPKNQQQQNREISTQVLSVTDHLTQRDAVDFWHRYFNPSDTTNHDNNGICVDAFCDAIQSEFSTNVFKHVFDDLPSTDAVNEEEVMQDFYGDL